MSGVCIPNVSSSRGGQLARVLGRETDSEDILRKGLVPEDDALLLPFPDSQHEVRVASDRRQQIPFSREIHVTIRLLCPSCNHIAHSDTICNRNWCLVRMNIYDCCSKNFICSKTANRESDVLVGTLTIILLCSMRFYNCVNINIHVCQSLHSF